MESVPCSRGSSLSDCAMPLPDGAGARVLQRRTRASRTRDRARIRAFFRGVRSCAGPPGLDRGDGEVKEKSGEGIEAPIPQCMEKVHDVAVVKQRQETLAQVAQRNDAVPQEQQADATQPEEKGQTGMEETAEAEVPVWMRKPEDVHDEEYAQFYKTLTGSVDFLSVRHFCVAGPVEVHAILFVPRCAPHRGGLCEGSRIRKYKNGVLDGDASKIMPDWLNFVEGVTEPAEMPPNATREFLVLAVRSIRDALVQKCLDMFAEIAERKNDYAVFHHQFCEYFRQGARAESTSRSKKTELMHFLSLHPSIQGDDPPKSTTVQAAQQTAATSSSHSTALRQLWSRRVERIVLFFLGRCR